MNQQTLFSTTPALVQPSRRDIIKRVFEKADIAFINDYRTRLIFYGKTHVDFIACDVTTAYERVKGKLSERQGKALGGLYMKMVTQGLIEKTGEYRARNQGSMAAVYRLK